MEQTRVKASHIELLQGSKHTKNVKLMLWICAQDKRRSNISKSIFFPLRNSCFGYFQAKKSVAHKLKRDCFIHW